MTGVQLSVVCSKPFSVILLLHHYHKGDTRQPDMVALCQKSHHLQAGDGCYGTPYRNIKTLNSMCCRAFAGYHEDNSFGSIVTVLKM
jgi:hypothetical protein